MRKLSPTLFLLVYSCQTVGLPLDAAFPPVPQEIIACSQRGDVVIPYQDLNGHDVEILWKSDRYEKVVVRRCLRRLIVRDQKLAGKP